MTSGVLIRNARKRAGLTQAELAQRVGIQRQQIARWEGDQVEPGLSTLRRVLRGCGYDLDVTLKPHTESQERDEQLEENLKLSPQERLTQLVLRLENE